VVGEQAMGLLVDSLGGCGVGRLDKAEDLAVGFVNPVAAVVDSVLVLNGDVGRMGSRDVDGGDAGEVLVDVHEQWHVNSSCSLSSADTISLVTGAPEVNDRLAVTHDPDATLDGILGRVRLDGAVFFRGEYTENWAYESLTTAQYAAMLRPGSERLTIFHVVASGRCWVARNDGVRLWANAGDVIVMPYGDQHRMGGQGDAELVSIAKLVEPPPWKEMPVARLGQGGARTDVVCGYLYSDDPLFDSRLRALPPLFVVTPPDGAARQWVQASIDFALQQTQPAPSGGLQGPPPRLSELLVREVLRIHLTSAPSYESAWLTALRDPILAPALASIHGSPEQKWSVELLAREANVSVSLLDERFRSVLHLPPIRYLTGWRMHVARDLLRSTDLSVAAVGRRVGYNSEEAFSRAFKRANGMSPSSART